MCALPFWVHWAFEHEGNYTALVTNLIDPPQAINDFAHKKTTNNICGFLLNISQSDKQFLEYKLRYSVGFNTESRSCV